MRISKNQIISTIVFITIVCSFFLYSAAYYPLLHSDHALNILMAHDYSLPETVYCWSQNRGGTFIPFLSQIFIWGFGINAIFAVSMSNYLILTFGFLGFSKLFKNKELMIPFALIWFFPYQRFIDITSFPIGMSYSLLGISLFFLLKIDIQKHLLKTKSNLWRIIVSGIIWFCAVWVSDLTFISLISFGLMTALFIVINYRKIQFNYGLGLILYAIILILIAFGIALLKTFATGVQEQFISFNTLNEIGIGFNIVWRSIKDTLLNDYLFTSIGAWIILILMIALILFFTKNFKQFITFKDYWISLFLVDFIAMLSVIFTSKWVFLNDFGRWYFIAPYISCSILIFLIIDKNSILGFSIKQITVCMTTILLIIGISTIESIYKTEGTYKSEYSHLKALNKLGKIGILGDYWNSYILSVANPSQIKSTAHQYSDIKNNKLFYEALGQPNIYVVKDGWFDNFPDTLPQFQYKLLKNGNSFEIAGVTLCKYKLISNQTFFPTEMYYNSNGKLQSDQSIRFSKQDTISDQHAIYGPTILFFRGNYTVDFYLKDLDHTQLTDQLLADVSTDYGINILALKNLNAACYNKVKNCYTLRFKINDAYRDHVEFRIKINQSMDFTFEKVVVEKLD